MIFSLPLTAITLFSYIFSLDSAEVSVDVVPLLVVKSLYFFYTKYYRFWPSSRTDKSKLLKYNSTAVGLLDSLCRRLVYMKVEIFHQNGVYWLLEVFYYPKLSYAHLCICMQHSPKLFRWCYLWKSTFTCHLDLLQRYTFKLVNVIRNFFHL